MNQNNSGSVLVVGAGDAIGSAIVRRFAREGYSVIGVRRKGEQLQPLVDELNVKGLKTYGWTCDARKEEEVVELMERIESEIAPLDTVIFNVGANVPLKVLETTSRKFQKIWEMACYAGFLTGREAARHMLPRGKGTILFTGATASVRGAAGFGAFAMAKHGLRAWVQSMARELGPQNIHVGHLIIDAAVDTPWIQENVLKGVSDRKPDDIVNPDSIAEVFWQMKEQKRDAWTFEQDLRPWVERW
jgi:NAD(P)-dependent dehydrogenase (short-subunit alcohol dehydrogenase family)